MLLGAVLVLAACSAGDTADQPTDDAVPTAEVVRTDVRQVETFDGTLTLADERPVVYQAEVDEPQEATVAGGAAGAATGVPSGSPAGAGAGGSGGSGGPSGQSEASTSTPQGEPQTPTTPSFGGGGATTTAQPSTTATTEPPSAGAGGASFAPVSFTATAQAAPSATASVPKTLTAIADYGQAIERGDVLYRVDDRPTVLLYGTRPAWRTLDTDSADGPDIEQLQQNLVDLGYGEDLTVDREFTSATADAVKAWEDDLGLDGDGTVDLGQIVFSDGAAEVTSTTSMVGSPVEVGTEILTLSSPIPVATITATIAESSALVAGATVQVTLPDGSKTTGTVASVGQDATRADGAAVSDSTIEITVALDGAPPEGIGDVSVLAVTVERPGVLTVPSSAITHRRSSAAVEVVSDPGRPTETKLVAVTTGIVSRGQVEITSGDVEEGDVVSLSPSPAGSTS